MLASAWLLWAASLLTQTPESFDELRVERLSAGHRFTDGPVWTPDNKLLFTDLPSNTIFLWTPGSKIQPLRQEPAGITAFSYDVQSRLYVCESRARRVVRIDPKKNKTEVLAAAFEGKRLNGPNDLTVRRDGNVYFTDSTFGSAAPPRELDFHGVFHIDLKGQIAAIARWKSGRPNGIALAPAGRILYVSNSDERRIVAFDLDKNGVASNQRTFVSNVHGVPAGLRTDEKGNLYVAAKGLSIYDPAGKLIRDVEMAGFPSNLAFGDIDHQSLFVTARQLVYRIRMPFKGYLPYHAPAAPTLTP